MNSAPQNILLLIWFRVLGQEFGQGHIAMLVSGKNYEEGFLVGMTGLKNGEGMTVAMVCYDTMLQCK